MIFLWVLTIFKTILQTCDNWDTDYNSYNWEPEFMTIFFTWQSRVTVDSIRNSCDVFVFFIPFYFCISAFCILVILYFVFLYFLIFIFLILYPSWQLLKFIIWWGKKNNSWKSKNQSYCLIVLANFKFPKVFLDSFQFVEKLKESC